MFSLRAGELGKSLNSPEFRMHLSSGEFSDFSSINLTVGPFEVVAVPRGMVTTGTDEELAS